jgi:deoxynucleoside triphosphate triphosphohydrolase SAMHD1
MRIIQSTDLEPFYQGIDRFCQEHLNWEAEEEQTTKIFADPIEGYATLAPWEVAIVDTPLFQRLRGIRQLGLAFLVYPTLGYSRFEHTIGVLARLKQVVTNIQVNLKESADSDHPHSLHDLPTDKQFTAAKLAALCHDLGHCIFSHVSETVLGKLPGTKTYPSAEKIQTVFRDHAGRHIPPAEIVAACIVSSAPFIKFLQQQATPQATNATRARDLAHAAAHLIMGLPIPGDPMSLFLEFVHT